MINVLLVEDHELYRMGLSLLLSKAEDINLMAEASDGIEGVKKAQELSPQVILMDIGLPNMDGIEATQRIKAFLPETKILIFTSRDGEKDILEDSFFEKGTHLVVTGILRGEVFVPKVYKNTGFDAILKVVLNSDGTLKGLLRKSE